MIASAPPFALEAAGLVKHFDGRKVLDGATLNVGAGETVAVTGANGAGKSTLLRVLAATSRPDSGTLAIFGISAAREPDAARRHLSLLGQEPSLYDELTAIEHLQWWARLTSRTADPHGSLRDAGLALHAQRRAATLSRGQRQRLALAMALLGDPAIVLLDEPFTGLDNEGRAWLERALQARRGRRATVMALHGDDARRLADRVLVLRHHALEAMS